MAPDSPPHNETLWVHIWAVICRVCVMRHVGTLVAVISGVPQSCTGCIYRCPRRYVPDFGRVFLMLKVYRYNPKHICPNLNGYGDNGQRKVWSSGGSTPCTCQLTALSVTSLSVVSYYGNSAHASDKQHMYFLQGDDVVSHVTSVLGIHVVYSAWNPKDKYDMSASVFVVQFNGFMSLTS